jgi:hypothetical protein
VLQHDQRAGGAFGTFECHEMSDITTHRRSTPGRGGGQASRLRWRTWSRHISGTIVTVDNGNSVRVRA